MGVRVAYSGATYPSSTKSPFRKGEVLAATSWGGAVRTRRARPKSVIRASPSSLRRTMPKLTFWCKKGI